MHSSQGLTPESSMRTHNLALNTQSRQKLAITNAEAGAMHLDEYSQLKAELNNAEVGSEMSCACIEEIAQYVAYFTGNLFELIGSHAM